jgi:hypothetical protein
MVLKPKGVDIHVESRARDQARWLIRDHGDEAERVLREKIRRKNVSDADRYRYKLTLREIARLRRADPEKYGAGKPMGLFASFRSLFS